MTANDRVASQSPRTLAILGVTGSIGDSTSDIVIANPSRFKVTSLVAHSNVDKLAARAIELGASRAIVADEARLPELKTHLDAHGIECAAGREAVLDAARETCDLVVCAMVGSPGMEPAMAAIEAGNTIALANKEALVCAGSVMMQRAREKGVRILPLDSEHNALFQVFEEANSKQIEAITLTASGGPFRTWSAKDIASAKLSDALNHPNWSMGQKVTIDSATLANKGLEVIEAHHLFAMGAESIKVVVHPQSIVHGMVHYDDGSVLAQLGNPDMRTPIAAALAWPDRYQAPMVKRLDLAQLGELSFEPPDLERFPMLRLAFESLEEGGPMPAAFNMANEVAVAAFIEGRCAFSQIPQIVEKTLDGVGRHVDVQHLSTLNDVLTANALAEGLANRVLQHDLVH